MRNRNASLSFIAVAILALGAVIQAPPVRADAPPAIRTLVNSDHYCVACHSANDARLASPPLGASGGGANRSYLSPCPAMQQFHQELALTGEAFDAIDHGRDSLAARGMAIDAIDLRLLAREESYPRLTDTVYHSIDAGVNDIRGFRYQLNKSYVQVQAARSKWTTDVIFVFGLVVTLVLLTSLAWGYHNTRLIKASAWQTFRLGMGGTVFVLIAFVIFALPIFTSPSQSPDITTAADIERQRALDVGTSAASGAENLSAQAWALGRISAAANPSDPRTGELALASAISATNELSLNAGAYWGKARALEESAIAWGNSADAAPPLVRRIEIASSRAWAFAAIADELAAAKPWRSNEFLVQGLARAHMNADPYFRSMDLKKMAVAWSRLDANQARRVADQIDDDFIRAWAFREMKEFGPAAVAARRVSESYLRVWALREIALEANDPKLLNEALADATSIADPIPRAYALAELGAANPARAAEIANLISPEFPAARADAFRSADRFEDAWREVEKIGAGFDTSRAQSELVGAWARSDPEAALTASEKIRDPFWRAQAQRAAAESLAAIDPTRALEVAQSIVIPSVRLQALTALAQETRTPALFAQAASLADQLHDPYPLRDLVIATAPVAPQQALALVDKLDREKDRARGLIAVAIALAPSDRPQANAVFDRAVMQAQATRVRGDPIASADLLCEIGARYASVDRAKSNEAFTAAIAAAHKVSTGF